MEYLTNLPWLAAGKVFLTFYVMTILSVTLYLHRFGAHRGIDLPWITRLILGIFGWITNGMLLKEWAPVHRKHHKHVDTEEDPHSPLVRGLWNVLRFGVRMYREEASNPETIRKFGKGINLTSVEANIFAHKYWKWAGLTFMYLVHMSVYAYVIYEASGNLLLATYQGLFFGGAIASLQTLAIPVMAASVINGFGHTPKFPLFYRNYDTSDTSTNVFPLGVLIGAEELHNNHHRYGQSARFSHRWFELDAVWTFLIFPLHLVGLVRIRYIKNKYFHTRWEAIKYELLDTIGLAPA